MKLVRSPGAAFQACTSGSPRVVGVTIGSFDALHRGHQVLFCRLRERLAALATAEVPALPVLMTFLPHPRQVLRGVKRSDLRAHPELLPVLPLRERIAAATHCGFEAIFAVRFSKRFSELSPTEFLSAFVFEPLNPRVIVIGDDWSFGKNRSGGVAELRAEAERRGASVEIVPAQCADGERIRTSAIRSAVTEGNLAAVAHWLGRPYEIIGRVRHGDHRGTQLGFPTANVHLTPRALPPFGVYAVRVRIEGRVFPGVANLGIRPTFQGSAPRCEVHIFDFGEDLYGKLLDVEFVEFVRPERRFSGVEELRAAIARDCETVRRRLLVPQGGTEAK